MTYPIKYSDEFLARVEALHASGCSLPDYSRWIDDHMGGRVVAFRERLLPHILAFTDLSDLDVLDFGCGTGSSTVVLAEASAGGRITGVDIDAVSLQVATLRFTHHGLDDRIATRVITPIEKVGDLDLPSEQFDFALLNGVLEHVVPFRNRSAVLLEVWRTLRPGGMLFISETPNLVWPYDRHTTGLPLIPWLPGTWAHRISVALGRHNEEGDLESRGRRGMTFWGIVRPLRAMGPVEVLNITHTGNRLFPGRPAFRPSSRRRFATAVLERGLGPILTRLGIPATALGPFIEYLCLRKTPAA